MVLIAMVCAAGWHGCGGGGGREGTSAEVVSGKIDDGATPIISTQVRCPVCDKPIVPDVHTESEDQRVYFDRKECLKKYRQDPREYRQKLIDQRL